jgi:hypothetical protein
MAIGFAFSPKVKAISPAPDGCYPNFTTAEGCDALSFLLPALEIQDWVGVRSF